MVDDLWPWPYRLRGPQRWVPSHWFLVEGYNKIPIQSTFKIELDISEMVPISVGPADLEVKVKGHQPWYATHRLDIIYPHSKYQKPTSKDKKVTAWTWICHTESNNVTLRSKFKVKGYQPRYATHHLDIIYLHPKYQKPTSKDKKVTARTWIFIQKAIMWP